MVEVPAAALKAAAFVDHVDFFSIGTNDLTQYALAAERGNAAVAALADPLDPGVLRLIDAVCRAAEGRCLVAVCGELAADERAVAAARRARGPRAERRAVERARREGGRTPDRDRRGRATWSPAAWPPRTPTPVRALLA